MDDKTTDGLKKLIQPLRVAPGSKVTLAKDYDPGFTAGWLEKDEGGSTLL